MSNAVSHPRDEPRVRRTGSVSAFYAFATGHASAFLLLECILIARIEFDADPVSEGCLFNHLAGQ
jgi:hypothetical protein